MRAFNTPSNGCTHGFVIVLGAMVGWPSYVLREFSHAFFLAFVLLVLCLAGLYILGISAGHETGKAKAKVSAIPKVLTHVNPRIESAKKQPAAGPRYDMKRPAA